MTLTRSTNTSRLLGTRYPRNRESLLDSRPAVDNIESDDSDVEREHSLSIGDGAVEKNTYGDVANALGSSFRPFRRMELPCMSFADKPPCKNVAARSLKHQRIDRSHVLGLHGEVPGDKLTFPFLKNADKERHRRSLVTLPRLGSFVRRTRDHIGGAGRCYEQRNDFDCGDIQSSKHFQRSLVKTFNHHLGKRHAQSRHLDYDSNEDAKSRETATSVQQSKHRSFGVSESKGDLLPGDIEDMYRQNGYYILKVDQMTDEERSGTNNYMKSHVIPVVTISGSPSDDLFKSEEFQKFKKHAEKVVNAPIRQGYARFASAKPTLAPAFSPQVLDTLEYNGTIVRQYFYETFCAQKQGAATDVNLLESASIGKDAANIDEHHECLAIDKKKWHSRCRERLIWTYGMVVKPDGDAGWGVIAIRGSCTCSVWPRDPFEGRRPRMRLFIDDV
ncbi:hypothetical protein HPB49_012536 [Dermacentor silvarum]|uniref:Uncharacterized protein n=1 Tax=Dermacentor silvarum TaxID=543639 RepID=A0ACB8C3Q3_DERSI|nr:hypothetical protein HPB49_012536 [Dermacentor silvarum]